jgi:hypothetical protein
MAGVTYSMRATGLQFGIFAFGIALCLLLLISPSAALFQSSSRITSSLYPSPVPGNLSAENLPPSPQHQFPTEIPVPDITYPSIAENHRPGIINRSFTFRFEKENVTIRANASTALYEGARNGIKYAVAPSASPVEELAPGYYRAFVNDPRQEALYSSLLQEFRAARLAYNLSDDEYLELMTVFVQDLPYDRDAGLHPENPPRFPVETIVDGTGDCDDKSALLAGLLSREGYDVALFLFIPEQHMAVGVRNGSYQFRNTGYMYIETTYMALVGDVPRKLILSEKYGLDGQVENVSILNSTPLVIRIGSGTVPYMSADDIRFILSRQQEIDDKIAELQVNLGNCTFGNTSCNETLLPEYNRDAGIHNYIVKHTFDRYGLSQFLHPVVTVPGQSLNTSCTTCGTMHAADAGTPASPTTESPCCLPAQEQSPLVLLWQDLRRLFSGGLIRSNITPVLQP